MNHAERVEVVVGALDQAGVLAVVQGQELRRVAVELVLVVDQDQDDQRQKRAVRTGLIDSSRCSSQAPHGSTASRPRPELAETSAVLS